MKKQESKKILRMVKFNLVLQIYGVLGGLGESIQKHSY